MSRHLYMYADHSYIGWWPRHIYRFSDTPCHVMSILLQSLCHVKECTNKLSLPHGKTELTYAIGSVRLFDIISSALFCGHFVDPSRSQLHSVSATGSGRCRGS